MTPADLDALVARLSPPLLDRNELLRPPFTHTRSCVALTPGNDESCTCGLHWRIQLATRITLQDAWTKRATEAETEVARLQDCESEVKRIEELECALAALNAATKRRT